MLSRIVMAPVALVYVAVVVLDRNPSARRASAIAIAVAGIAAIAVLARG